MEKIISGKKWTCKWEEMNIGWKVLKQLFKCVHHFLIYKTGTDCNE